MACEAKSADTELITLRDYFDQSSTYWQKVYTGQGFVSYHMNERRQAVLSMVDTVSAGQQLTILDLGCGTGALARSLMQRGHRVACLDGSQSMLNKLMHSMDQGGNKRLIGALRASVDTTAFQNASFDLVVCVGVIQYQFEDDGIVKEISRVLKQNGHCIFTLPNLLSVTHVTDPLYGLLFVRRLWRRVLTRKEARPGACGMYGVVGERPTSREIYNKKYTKWELWKKFSDCGMILQEACGLGFGPFTFFDRNIFPESGTIRLSAALTALSQRPLFRWSSYLANRWVFLAQKI